MLKFLAASLSVPFCHGMWSFARVCTPYLIIKGYTPGVCVYHSTCTYSGIPDVQDKYKVS